MNHIQIKQDISQENKEEYLFSKSFIIGVKYEKYKSVKN